MYDAIVFLLCLAVILAVIVFNMYMKSAHLENEATSLKREAASRVLSYEALMHRYGELECHLDAVNKDLASSRLIIKERDYLIRTLYEDVENRKKMLIDVEERYKVRIVEVEDVLMKENPTVTVRKEVREVVLTMPLAVQMAVVMYLKMAVSGSRLRFDDMKSAMEIIAKLESDLKEIKEGDELKLS